MKFILTSLSLVFLFLLVTSSTFGQEFAKVDKSPMDAAYYPARAAFRFFQKTEDEKVADRPIIRALYSRPKKNERNIFADIVKSGELWRVGANESTEIHFFEDVMVGDTKIGRGRYTIYVMPTDAEWTVHFSETLDSWGHYTYDEAATIASITVPVEKAKETIEAFSIAFESADEGAHMIMGWDDRLVRVPIQIWK